MITPEEINFKPADGVFSKAKRFLSSYDVAGMVDEGEFPTYTKEVLNELRLGVYKEQEAVIAIKNYKGKLPEGFKVLHGAWKCSPTVSAQDVIHLQGQGVSVYQDVTWELLEGSSKCEIETIRNSDERILEKITVRQYVKDTVVNISYDNPILLRLSPNVRGSQCSDDCENRLSSSIHEISIRDGQVLTNFTNDCIFLQYYSIAVDEFGVPMIPDLEYVEKAIEWNIIYQTLLQWWYNKSVPDIENLKRDAEIKYNHWLDVARYERRFPSFQQMINNVRRQRNINKIRIFTN